MFHCNYTSFMFFTFHHKLDNNNKIIHFFVKVDEYAIQKISKNWKSDIWDLLKVSKIFKEKLEDF